MWPNLNNQHQIISLLFPIYFVMMTQWTEACPVTALTGFCVSLQTLSQTMQLSDHLSAWI